MAPALRPVKTVPGVSFEPDSSQPNTHRPRNSYIPGGLGRMGSWDYLPWTYGQRLSHINEYFRMLSESHNRASMSMEQRNSFRSDDVDFRGSSGSMPPPLPEWIWTIFMTTLGIGSETSYKRYCLATLLHVLTLTSAFAFGASGLFFNAYDTLSEFTKTSVLLSITKSVLGLYWIGLGIYANILAVRLFSNKRMVDCIRFHSKTFLKVSTAFIVMLLSVIVVGVNLYSNMHLLETQTPANVTLVNDANCVSIGVNVFLCKIYFGSKFIYTCFCLIWNLLIVGIYLSVCRTHTIGVRQFMKELLIDIKIYIEFFKIQALERQAEYVQSLSAETRQIWPQPGELHSHSDTYVWDDDIAGFDMSNSGEPPSNADLLQTLMTIRIKTRARIAEDIVSNTQDPEVSPQVQTFEKTQFTLLAPDGETESTEETLEAIPASSPSLDGTSNTTPVTDPQDVEPPEKAYLNKREENNLKQQNSTSMLSGLSPPIMSNEELLFTYFQLLRRFSSTSRLLQRWISNWITFVMLWCALLVVYWTSHTAQLSGIIQFLIPLVTLGLLASGYAEVNFEGERLMKCLLPTEERMPVIYYFQNSKLELKIFSFTMTYNTIVTVIAGIAVTFATRIILDQFSLGKSHIS